MKKQYPLLKSYHNDFIAELKALPNAESINVDFWQKASVVEILSFMDCHSDYLRNLCRREVCMLPDIFEKSPQDMLNNIQLFLQKSDNIHKDLRIAKRRMALYLAICDINKQLSTLEICHYLSLFADLCVKTALKALWPEFYRRAKIKNRSKDEVFGFFILGLGKLGGFELNYSSDIDLIALFDPQAFETEDDDALAEELIRLCRRFIQMLEVRDGDGYVFRVDFRLRPDPASTALVMSVNAAESYYEIHGQNWERSALMKARIIAGDDKVGQLFLQRLTPFLWRKNLDYAAIREIHAIKKRIHQYKGGSEIKQLEGHNIKLGRGGIREIEFFAQAWQLIWGGRNLELRIKATLDVLKTLKNQEKITNTVYKELKEAYLFLRDIEHRLQMRQDEQTQTLPSGEEEFHRFSLFCGYANEEAFRKDMAYHLNCVEKHYASLFEEEDSAKGIEFNFSSLEADEQTLQELTAMGFSDPMQIDYHIRQWFLGSYRATRSQHAQTLLYELIAPILEYCQKEEDPQNAFMAFDRFLSKLSRGVQILAILHAHHHILMLLLRILNGAPALGQHLQNHPHLLDALLAGALYAQPPSQEEMRNDIQQRLASFSFNKNLDLQDYLELAASWSQDQRFILGIQALYAELKAAQILTSYSRIAQTTLQFILPPIIEDFEKNFGKIAGGKLAVLALGRLGSLEMTPTSDLDLIFIFEVDDYLSQSDGQRSLSCSQYYSKLGQRIINALTAATPAGTLYEVDMRLRPSGNKGPLAVSFESFKNYQYNEAWTWEHMALCRSRIVSEQNDLTKKICQEIHHILSQKRDKQTTKDIMDMRARLHKEKPAKDIFDIKHISGGLLDIEFIIQHYILLYAHQYPSVLQANSQRALLSIYECNLISKSDYDALSHQLNLCQILQLYQRLSYGKLSLNALFSMEASHKESDIAKAILKQTNMPSLSALLNAYQEGLDVVQKIYQHLFNKKGL